MGTAFVLAYADYAVFLSAIAMIILGTHAFSLRYSGRTDRAWGWLGAAAVLLSLAHLPEILIIAGVAENPALVAWPGLLVIVWVCLLRFIASGQGFMATIASKRAFVPALGVAGALIVSGLAPFGLASEAGAVLVSLALLGVPDGLRHLSQAPTHTPARAKRGVVWLSVFALTYAPGVILVQTGETRTASFLLLIRVVAGLLLAFDFGGYTQQMTRSDVPGEARGPQSLARAAIGVLFVGSLVMGFGVALVVGRLGVDGTLGRLESNTAVSAAAVDGEEVAMLRGSLFDLDTPGFEIVDSALTRVVAADPSVSAAYLMREIDGEVIILAEGDTPAHNSDLPGTVHVEASPGLTAALRSFESFNEGPRDDQWGEWYSSYAPIVDSLTGERVALLGLDMDAAIVEAARAESRLGGLALALGISILLHGFYTVLLMTRGASSKIADSERRFRRVFDNAPEAILVLDANTLHIVDANPYAEEFLGYELDRLSSLRIDDICVHEGSSMPLRELVAVSSEQILDREAVFVTADGRRIDVEATGVSFDYEGCDAVMLFVRDASQRRIADHALNFQAEFNALITDISRSFMNLSAEDIDEQITRALHRIGVFAEVDRAYVFAFEDADHMSNTHEWRDDGIPGRMTAFRHAKTSMYPTLTARLLGGGDVYVPDVRLAADLSDAERAGLGAAGVRSLLVVPMTVSGFTVGFMGFDSIRDTKEWSADTISLLRIVADIVATAQARTRAEAELQKLSRAIEQSPVAVIITDAHGAIEYVNPKFTQLTGYELAEAVGQNPRILKSGLTSEGVYEDLWSTVLAGKEWSGQFINVRKDREQYWASATISAMRREDGTITHFVGVQEDVTEQRKAEDALEQAKRQAESANRAKSEFLATMSHEIRTPMNAIIGMAELLQDTELSIQQSRYVEIFQRAGESLLELINSVLDLSKIEADKLDLEHAPFDVRELAETTGSVVGVRAGERGIELLYRVKPDVPTMLLGDSARLRQVLMNLLGNAIKFTEEGQVLLTISRDPDRPGEGDLLFSVADTGIGIAQDKLSTIFESFTQADSSTTRKFGGTGLGLTISKRIVELMGGRMWVESAEGEGATFLFSVPFEVADGVSTETTTEGATELAGLRMLVVDDNETNRLIVSEMVSCWGINAEEAVDAPSGLELAVKATEQGRPFDIIVLDHQMPGMDGFEFLEALRADERLAASAVIMLSSDPRGRNAEASRRLGLLDYLLKPVRRGELREAVSMAVMSGGSLPSGREALEPAANVRSFEVDASRAGEAPASRILLVEDSEDNRFLIRHYLDATSHVLFEAVDGKEGLEAVMDAAEPFDLVLMDMQMPVMDGYEATRRIRAWESKHGRDPVCVLALTAYAMEEEVKRSLDAGCNGHLFKPIKKKTLLAAIDSHVKEGVHHVG